MKKLLTSLAAFTALTTVASAADLPRRAAPPVFTPIPVFTWTGFYAGFNAGYGFNADDGSTAATTFVGVNQNTGLFRNASGQATDGLFAFSNSNSRDGFTGGAQIGYNYQFTPGSGIVIGVEADAQYVDFGGKRNGFASQGGTLGGTVAAGTLVPGVTIVNPNGLSSLDFYGTVRGRIGYAFDRVLFYGTGGFAYGTGSSGQLNGVSEDDFRTGYAAGGGVEYALPTDSFLNFFRSSAVTFKLEGLYVNLDRNNRANGAFSYVNGAVSGTVFNPNVTTTGYVNRNNDEFAVVRAGINYKFGSY